MDDGAGAPGGDVRVAWSAALGAGIVRRLAKGESLAAICARDGAPHRSTVREWARARPEFGEAMAAAAKTARLARRRADLMRAMRPRDGRGRWRTYTHAAGAEICRRLSEGETLIAICRDEAMPCYSTVLNWARAVPEFAEAYAEARRLAADYLFDEAREVGLAATPGTVWADRLRFDIIRWQAARIAPKKYVERVLAAEEIEAIKADYAEAARRRPEQTILLRTFGVGIDEQGRRRVVSYTPDPKTGRVVKEMAPLPGEEEE